MAEGSPFFGDLPESLALLEVDLPSTWSREELELPAPPLRNALGVSHKFFDRLDTAPPTGLKPLRFNGDTRCSQAADLLVAIAGDWDETLDLALRTRRALEFHGFTLVAANIGNKQGTDRDHTGFIDGTSNLQELTASELLSCTSIQPGDDDDSYVGSSYVLIRKYEEDLRMWSTLSTKVQEQLVGRRKADGTFLDGSMMWGLPSSQATPDRAHIRCANPRNYSPNEWKERVYRRSITYQELGSDGQLHAGLLFVAVARDPDEQVVRIHNTRLLPSAGRPDLFLSSGYVTPLRTSCYLIPTRSSPAYEETARHLGWR